MPTKNEIKEQAEKMLQEMMEQRLEVILVPAPEPKHEGHMIRQAINRNPIWFQGTGLNRKETLMSLNRIRFGTPLRTRTDDRVEQIVINQAMKKSDEDPDDYNITIVFP